MTIEKLKKTAFYDFHIEAGAKMVAFAGYEMPVSFEGVLAEHLHVRNGGIGLFDVSHMGQIIISGSFLYKELAKILPTDLDNMAVKSCKYSVLLNHDGGIIDDIIIYKHKNGDISLVANGSRKYIVLEYLRNNLPNNISIIHDSDKILLALQGKKSVSLLARHIPQVIDLKFMTFNKFDLYGTEVKISRSGYTGEDGFEISCDIASAYTIYELFLKNNDVMPIGLGARDSLRLEAGLCLYGQDLSEDINPVEAGIKWCLSKENTLSQKYIGASSILDSYNNGADRVRIGMIPDGKAPIRAGTELYNQDFEKIGFVSSGGFSPVLNHPIAMGYIDKNYKNQDILALLRGKYISVKQTNLPFVQHNYER